MKRKFSLLHVRSGARCGAACSGSTNDCEELEGTDRLRGSCGADDVAPASGFTLPNGFTLMELLIVMAIIAILMLIAIPTVGSLKKHADELSAVQSIRATQQAEMQYESTYPANGYACDLKALGGDPSAGAPSPTSAQIL